MEQQAKPKLAFANCEQCIFNMYCTIIMKFYNKDSRFHNWPISLNVQTKDFARRTSHSV